LAIIINLMKRQRVLLLLLICLAVSLLGVYGWMKPRLVSLSPAPGAEDLPAGTTLQLTFSQPMKPQTIEERLTITPTQTGKLSWLGNTLTYTPDRPWPNGATIHVLLVAGGQSAGWLPLPLNEKQEWFFIIEEPVILYLFPANSPADLYELQPVSGKITRLTQVEGEMLDYSVSDNGLQVYYSVNQGFEGSTLYRLDRSSGQSQVLREFPQALCRFPQISAQGDFLAFELNSLSQGAQEASSEIWILPIQDTGSGGPVQVSVPGHISQQPQWSPTGMLTYYDSNQQAFVLYNPQNEVQLKIPSQTGQAGDWDPAGENYLFGEILFSLSDETAKSTGLVSIPTSHLMRFDFSQQTLTDLSQLDVLEDTAPVYSPDGRWVVFARKYLNLPRWTPGRQIWLMAEDGSQTYALTDEAEYNHYGFSWSPDGEQLLYLRFNQVVMTGSPEIWFMDIAGGEPRMLVEGGYAAQWIP
jgi:hypothetical protein